MTELYDRIYKALTGRFTDMAVIHSCPQAPSVIPCVTFHIGNIAPFVYADGEPYAYEAEIITDIWHDSWESGAMLAADVKKTLTAAGFEYEKYEDNVTFNQFNKRDASVRITQRFKGITV